MSNSPTQTALLKRYCLFILGLFFNAFGVILVTVAQLGTSPISSTAYVASLNSPLTIGTYIYILNAILIIGQILLLGKEGTLKNKRDLLLQIPATLLFGAFMDFDMWLLSGFPTDHYLMQVAGVVAGCVIMAVGIIFAMIADVTMNSAEYFIQIMSKRFGWQFGNIKLCFDIILLAIAVGLSLLLSGRIEGVREGTVIVAVLTGPVVRLLYPRIKFIGKYFGREEMVSSKAEPDTEESSSIPNLNAKPVIITLSREFGSGGHEIGQRIAQSLGIPFYDEEIIKQAAAESGLSEKVVSEKEQHIANRFLYEMAQDYEAPIEKRMSLDDALFVAQSRVIRRLAQKGSCLIVGRCADTVLSDYPNNIDLFFCADEKDKVERVQRYGIKAEDAASEIEKVNRARANHYHVFTGKTWGDSRNYDFSCNTSRFTTEEICQIVGNLYRSHLPVPTQE